MPAQNTLQNANPHDHVELKNLAIVDPIGKFDILQTNDSFKPIGILKSKDVKLRDKTMTFSMMIHKIAPSVDYN